MTPSADLPYRCHELCYQVCGPIRMNHLMSATNLGMPELDAWSRKVFGYTISRFMDASLATADLKAAIRDRVPPKGCVSHSDKGSKHASEIYRTLLVTHGLTGATSRRGNPYDNAKAEGFMKMSTVPA